MKTILLSIFLFLASSSLSIAQECAISGEFEILSTSQGSPLSGPFQSGEQVDVKFTLTEFTGVDNGCQWLQGLIPQFGNGWDPASFDENGMPVISSEIEKTAQYPATWGWYTDVHYNNATTNVTVGEFDDDEFLDICHASEGNCSNSGTEQGDLMPPGWYSWNPLDGINGSGHPDLDWGDGFGCGFGQGPWTVTFTLNVRTENNEDFNDLSLKMYTVSDGETGSYSGPPSICSMDLPFIFIAEYGCPGEVSVISVPADQICSGVTTLIEFETDFSFSWLEYVSLDGAISGSGVEWNLNLVNESEEIQYLEFYLNLYNGLGCSGGSVLFSVEVYPEIDINLNSDSYCAVGLIDLGGNPTATNHVSEIELFDWSIDSIGNVSNPEVYLDSTFSYSLVVEDDNGCSVEATNTITVVDFNYEIILNYDICNSDLLITIGTNIDTGNTNSWIVDGAFVEDSYSLDLEYSVYGSGPIDIEVTTENEGCIFSKDTLVYLNTIPSFIFNQEDSLKYCPSNSVVLEAILTDEYNNLEYSWTGPMLTSDSSSIFIEHPGLYYLTVTSEFGCSSFDSITIFQSESLNYNVIGNSSTCFGDELLELSLSQEADTVSWYVDGALLSNEQNISLSGEINGNGAHDILVIIVDSFSCESMIQYEIDLGINETGSMDFIPDSLTACTNVPLTLMVDSIDVLFEVIWISPLGDVEEDSIQVFESGLYSLIITTEANCILMDSMFVQLNDPISYEIIGSDLTCINDDTLNLTISDNSYQSINWLLDGNLISSADELSISADLFGVGSHILLAIIEDSTACDYTIEKDVFLSLLESIYLPYDSLFLCPQDEFTIQFQDIDYDAFDITWTGPNGITMQDSIIPFNNGFHHVNLSSPEGCTIEDSVYVEFFSTYQLVGDTIGCSISDILELSISDSSNIEISWYVDDVFYSSDYKIELTESNHGYGYHNISATIIDSNLCESQVNKMIFLDTLYNIDLSSIQDSVQLCPQSNYGIISDSFDLSNYSILWMSPNENTSLDSIQVNETGLHLFKISNDIGCVLVDSVYIDLIEVTIPVIIGEDSICFGELSSLSLTDDVDQILWSNGEITNQTQVPGGTYFIQVVDSNGCSSQSLDFIVHEETEIIANFEQNISEFTVDFMNTSTNGETYLWNFGDTETSTEENPSHTYTIEDSYEVELLVNNMDCSDKIIKEIVIMIDDVQNYNSDIHLYPNPTSSNFYIEFDGISSIKNLQIRDITGRLFKSKQLRTSNNQIYIQADFEAGMYFVTMEFQDQIISKKITFVN